jgi:hypothetical protein
MWTDNLKVGDLIIQRASDSAAPTAIVMEVRETNRPTYGKATVDTSRLEFKIWHGGVYAWLQDVEIRALWKNKA